MKASLVIPSRGGVERLPHLLACLAAQTESDWEAIVVVDGDIDDSESLLKAWPDARVKHIIFPENRGRVAALNAGFEQAQGTVLIRCDDDLRPGREYVERNVTLHAGEPVALVGLYRNVLPETPYARAYGRASDEQFRTEAYNTPRDRWWRYWAGNASVTRETFDRVGPYDPDYRAYGWEDVDWGYRVAQLGVPVILEPSLETPHHVAATTTEVRAVRAFLAGAARHLFEIKHGHDVLPPLANPQGAWGHLVHRVSGPLTRRRVATLGRAVDRLLPFAPRPVATKLVALAVEAAAAAGYERPTDTSNDV